MKVSLSGRRTPESAQAVQELVDFLEKFGEIQEIQESILTIDGRETILVAFCSQSYYSRKGYYWFSLAKTKYTQLLLRDQDHAWVVLICGTYGRYFIPIHQVKELAMRVMPNRRDGRWDLYVRLAENRAYFGLTHIRNDLDITDQLQHFEQIWQRPEVEEEFADEALYIPDSLPSPNRKIGNVLRVVRDTACSRAAKELYSYECQVCGRTIPAPFLRSRWYCEAHHVQPLGQKFNGPDHISNILALCPTHHCMMDLGVLAVDPLSLEVLSIQQTEQAKGRMLTLKREHGLNQKYLQFHLEKIYLTAIRWPEIPLTAATDQTI